MIYFTSNYIGVEVYLCGLVLSVAFFVLVIFNLLERYNGL